METGTGTDLGKKTGKLKLKSKIKCLIHKDDDSRNSVAVFVSKGIDTAIFLYCYPGIYKSRLSQAVQIYWKGGDERHDQNINRMKKSYCKNEISERI